MDALVDWLTTELATKHGDSNSYTVLAVQSIGYDCIIFVMFACSPLCRDSRLADGNEHEHVEYLAYAIDSVNVSFASSAAARRAFNRIPPPVSLVSRLE